jgi:small-conductance mechanosensitive channel
MEGEHVRTSAAQLAQEAPPAAPPSDPPTDPELSESVTTSVDIACGNQGAFCDAILEWTGSEAIAETVSWVIGVPIKLVLIITVAVILNRIARVLIRRTTRKIRVATEEHGSVVVGERALGRAEERARTMGQLMSSIASAIIWGTAFIMVFETFGISLIPVIASAGILSLAIGFGAQSIVEDLLRGIFMLIEDQFGVGDRIDVGLVNGTVERVTLRTVVIRDPDGTLWHVPNSEIQRVANESQIRSRATLDLGVAYSSDLDEAIAVLERTANELAAQPEWVNHIKEPPEVQGIQELGEDVVMIRVIVWITAGDRRAFERVLRLRLKEALDEAQIEMPNRQLDVWLRRGSRAA